ncbi:MAG: ATP phosphoribosyltransferase [Anaerolineae bacterium]|jgi:ATP phosphoribosyltransferase|nr:ATP phosphoribosyltransferase [Anaerolineae bacterium]
MSKLRLALPSKGALGDESMGFLANAGLKVYKPNERQYTAIIPAIKGIEVVFQRPVDVFRKVNDGSVDLGITGYDVMREHEDESDEVIVIDHLRYGECELVLAVPDSWIDVSSLTDLADLTLAYKEKGREIRIATKYRNLTREWLYDKGITHFSLVNAEGALEAAPTMGYADMIADISATGTTLKENRLKVFEGGVILKSDACLIGNRQRLNQDRDKLQLTKNIVELIEAHLNSRRFVSLTVNIQGDSAQQVGALLIGDEQLSGLIGPGITEIHPKKDKSGGWYSINITIPKGDLLAAMEKLRKIGATDIAVLQPSYIFSAQSETFERLQKSLERKSEIY